MKDIKQKKSSSISSPLKDVWIMLYDGYFTFITYMLDSTSEELNKITLFFKGTKLKVAKYMNKKKIGFTKSIKLFYIIFHVYVYLLSI